MFNIWDHLHLRIRTISFDIGDTIICIIILIIIKKKKLLNWIHSSLVQAAGTKPIGDMATASWEPLQFRESFTGKIDMVGCFMMAWSMMIIFCYCQLQYIYKKRILRCKSTRALNHVAALMASSKGITERCPSFVSVHMSNEQPVTVENTCSRCWRCTK